jgi:heptose-I-phosphate ethanolaminephosphotransferase
MLHLFTQGIKSDDTRKAALKLLGSFVAFLAALFVSLDWAKEWLWPNWVAQSTVWLFVGFWLAFLVLSILSMRKDRAHHLLWLAFAALWCALFRPASWSVGFLAAVFSASLITRRHWWRLAAAILLSTLLVLIAGYERMYGPLTADAVAAVLQTNSQEAGGFVKQHLTKGVLTMVFLFATIQAILFVIQPKIRLERARAILPFALIVVLFGSAGQFDRYQAVRKSIANMKAILHSLVRPSAGEVNVGDNKPLDVVLIIGESSSRWHWQLYGYPGETNPRLVRMRDQFLQFNDVVSADSHTVLSLTDLFYRPYYSSGSAVGLQEQKKASLVDLLNAANVETVWFSAQEAFGPWAAPIARLAKDSSRSEFFAGEATAGAMVRSDSPDTLAKAAVIRELATPSKGQKRLIVEHMSAAHGPYCKHALPNDTYSPPASGTAFFGAAPDFSQDVLCYDKAIRYTDSIVADVIEAAANRARPTVVVFVPDHGEAPEEGTGHNNAVHSARHVEIPMLVHFNAAAKQVYAIAYGNLTENIHKPFVNRWVNELLMDLMNVSSGGIRREIDSPLSASFTAPPRELFRASSVIQYDQLASLDGKDALELTRLNLRSVVRDGSWDKPLYAARVNSVAAALEAKQYFSGVEMDVFFDQTKSRFNVGRLAAADTGPTLDQQLKAFQDKGTLQLLFDFHNPIANQAANALAALNSLDDRWRIKKRTVLWLPELASRETTRSYSDAGWRTSFTVPSDFALCGNDANSASCAMKADRLVEDAQAAGAEYLSFDERNFASVARYIAPRRKTLKLLGRASTEGASFGLSKALANLPRFDGLIIQQKSRFHD